MHVLFLLKCLRNLYEYLLNTIWLMKREWKKRKKEKEKGTHIRKTRSRAMHARSFVIPWNALTTINATADDIVARGWREEGRKGGERGEDEEEGRRALVRDAAQSKVSAHVALSRLPFNARSRERRGVSSSSSSYSSSSSFSSFSSYAVVACSRWNSNDSLRWHNSSTLQRPSLSSLYKDARKVKRWVWYA